MTKETAEIYRRLVAWLIECARDADEIDGAELQEMLTKEGVFRPVKVSERCGETCACAEYDGFPTDCYRLTDAGRAAVEGLEVRRLQVEIWDPAL
jgi:hypothetical protein